MTTRTLHSDRNGNYIIDWVIFFQILRSTVHDIRLKEFSGFNKIKGGPLSPDRFIPYINLEGLENDKEKFAREKFFEIYEKLNPINFQGPSYYSMDAVKKKLDHELGRAKIARNEYRKKDIQIFGESAKSIDIAVRNNEILLAGATIAFDTSTTILKACPIPWVKGVGLGIEATGKYLQKVETHGDVKKALISTSISVGTSLIFDIIIPAKVPNAAAAGVKSEKLFQGALLVARAPLAAAENAIDGGSWAEFTLSFLLTLPGLDPKLIKRFKGYEDLVISVPISAVLAKTGGMAIDSSNETKYSIETNNKRGLSLGALNWVDKAIYRV